MFKGRNGDCEAMDNWGNVFFACGKWEGHRIAEIAAAKAVISAGPEKVLIRLEGC